MRKKLSPSALNEFNDCARCFWLGRREDIKKPRGIFPSLPGSVDRVLKTYYDRARKHGRLTNELIAAGITGKLWPDQAWLDGTRTFGRGQMTLEVDGWEFGGLLDDLIQEDDGRATVLDYKSRGSAPKAGQTERYYQAQGDGYAALLREHGKKPSGKAHFAYYWPVQVFPAAKATDIAAGMLFRCQPVTIDVSAERSLKLIRRAIACLESSRPPDPTAGCETCNYVESRTLRLNDLKAEPQELELT